MSHLKPGRSKVEIVDRRRLLISFVPEEGLSSGLESKTRMWAQQFSRHLNNGMRNFSALVYREPGTHQAENNRISGTYSDFLVVFTVDYASESPPELDKIIEENHQLGDQNSIRMWLARYDADSYSIWAKEYKYWHVLTGKGKDGERFRRYGEGEGDAWKDDLTDAAKAIHDHPSCDRPSDICPWQPSSAPKRASRLSRILGRLYHSN